MFKVMQKRIFFVVLILWAVVCSSTAAGKFVLVIDAGHGGKDSGAPGKYSVEKDINLPVALAFGKYVERNCPDVKVVYTRKSDVFVELKERANIANRNKADLFISIHTNALDGGKIARGFQTYTMGMHNAAENLNVAKRENSVILIEKNYKQTYAGFDPKSSESYIMFELMQDKNMSNSVDLAKTVQLEVCACSGRANKGVHQAGLLVLRETSMPGCLIELGFITTPDEEDFLNSKDGQDKLARGIFNAFVKYKKKHRKLAQNEVTDDDNVPLMAEEEVVEPNVTKDNKMDDEQYYDFLADEKFDVQGQADSLSMILDDQSIAQNDVLFVKQRAVRNIVSPSLLSPPSLLSQVMPEYEKTYESQDPTPPKTDEIIKNGENDMPVPQNSFEGKSENIENNEKHENTVTNNSTPVVALQNNDNTFPNKAAPENVVSEKKTSKVQEQDTPPVELTSIEKKEKQDSTSISIPQQSPLPSLPQNTLISKTSAKGEAPRQTTDSLITFNKDTLNHINEVVQTLVGGKTGNIAKKDSIVLESPKSAANQASVELKPQITSTPNLAIKPAKNSKPVQKKTETKSKTIFKVQISASTEEHVLDSAFFKGLKDVNKFHENGMVKYTVGNTDNFAEIQELRSALIKDFPGAFIIAFRDDKKISLQEAIAEYKKQKQIKK